MFALNGKHAGQTRYNLTFLTVYVTRTKSIRSTQIRYRESFIHRVCMKDVVPWYTCTTTENVMRACQRRQKG
jgi:hypothetical protein